MTNQYKRVMKHRVEKSIKNGNPAIVDNLIALKNAGVDIKPYVKESKKIYDSISTKSITTKEKNLKSKENKNSTKEVR